MPGLNVPTPTLEPMLPRTISEDRDYFLIETPLAVRSAAVTRLDGSVVGPRDLKESSFLLCRLLTVAAPVEVWDAKAQSWFDESSPQARTATSLPMAFDRTTALPWMGVLANSVSKATGEKLLVTPVPLSDYPRYFARTRFVTRDKNALTGEGESAPPIRLYSFAENARPQFQLNPDDPQTAKSWSLGLLDGSNTSVGAVELSSQPPASIRLRLGPAGVGEVGSINITSDTPEGTIEITNHGQAAIRLLPTGEIELLPKPGQRVVVKGTLVGRNAANVDTVIYP